ncbi:MAG: copper-binding protein [Ahrensia sp.]|nr:copper-binding protein [Ahrensia sp.]
MKIKTLVAAVAITFAATAAFATDYTKGTVKKIDAKSGKVTVKHEELKNLGMPAMTMVFVPKDDAVLAKLKEGGNIEFVAERVKGKLTLVEVK